MIRAIRATAVALSVAVLATVCAPDPSAAQTPQCGIHPVGMWHFDEGAGQVAEDSSGYGRDGRLGTTTGVDSSDPRWVAGTVGDSALRFDGVDDWVDFGPGPSVSSHTLEAWLRPAGKPERNQIVFGPEGTSSGGCHYGAALAYVPVDGEGYFDYVVGPTGCGNDMGIYGGPAVVPGTWYHVAGTYDSRTRAMKLYVDGVPIASYTGISFDRFPRLLAGTFWYGVTDSPQFVHAYAGDMDEVRVWPVALTETEVALRAQKQDIDVDRDGLPTAEELIVGTDPCRADSDIDGLLDGTEVAMAAGTACPNPLLSDTDGDGLLDGSEVASGTNPCAADSDGDGVPDDLDPEPLIPNEICSNLEQILRDLSADISGLSLWLFSGTNPNAREGFRNAAANRAMTAANIVGQWCRGEKGSSIQGAIGNMESLLDKTDGSSPSPDWMIDSPQKSQLAADVVYLIAELESLQD